MMNNNTTNEKVPPETGDNLGLFGGPTSAFKPPAFRSIQPYQMSSNYLVYEEEHVDFTMLNVVNQFDQRSKRNFDGRKLDSTNMFRNMMMFRRERSYQCDQLSIPLSANVGVYEYLNYYDSIKLTEVCNYVDAIAEPLAQNQPSYDQSDVSMNLFNNEENYYETNHNQKNIELTNSNYEDYHEQLYDKYSDTNQNNNFISDINPPNDYQRFDDNNFSVDDQQQFNTQNVKGIDYFEIDDESNNSDSSVEWLDSEEEINLKDNIEAFEGSDNEEHSAFATFEENLANGQDGDELYGTYNEETRLLEIEQSNLSLEVSSNSCHNLQIQINDSVDPDSSTTNSMQPMDDKSIAIRHKQELPSASPPQPNNDHLNDEHDSNLSNGDETEVDESWKEYESDRQSLVAIDNARNGTNTNCHEPSEDTSLNGSIPSTSDHQLHRSSPRITTDQEKNNPDSAIDYPKSKETTPKKRKQLLHSNEPKKKARKDNEEDDKEFSDDSDDDEDGVDGRRVRNEYRKMVKTIVFDCPECSQFFVSKHKLNEHLLGVHCKSPFICQAFGCKQPFDNSKLLKRHCKLHDKKTKWTCTEVNCKYSTLDRGCLYSHLFAYHAKGRFQCRLCSKEFQFRNEAKKHTDRAHKSNNTVQCNFGGCLYKSSCKSRLKEHRLCHINLKPYECTWSGCGHASNRYRHVVKHVLTMHFQLPSTLREMKQSKIKCDRDPKEFVCTKSFDFDAILKREQQKAQRNYYSKDKDGKGHSIASTSCVPENPFSNGSNAMFTNFADHLLLPNRELIKR